MMNTFWMNMRKFETEKDRLTGGGVAANAERQFFWAVALMEETK